MSKALLIGVLIVFAALTGYTLAHYGGLFAWLAFYTRDPASWQICCGPGDHHVFAPGLHPARCTSQRPPVCAMGCAELVGGFVWAVAVLHHCQAPSMNTGATEWFVRFAFAAAWCTCCRWRVFSVDLGWNGLTVWLWGRGKTWSS
jgi:hypothetical protein